MKSLSCRLAAILLPGLAACMPADGEAEAEAGAEAGSSQQVVGERRGGEDRDDRDDRDRPAEAVVFATGLTSPRHMRVGPDGLLYVAEAGVGGDSLSTCPIDNMFSAAGPYRGGLTGRVSRIHRDGTVEVVAEGIASVLDGTDEALGPTDMAWIDGTLYVLTEGGGCTHGLPDHPSGVVRVNRDRSVTYVADVSAFIRANPVEVEPMCGPQGDCEPDGVPHSMIAVGPYLHVVETNHNSILRIDPRAGCIERLHDLSVLDPAPIRIRRFGDRALIGSFDGDLLELDLRRPRRAVRTLASGFNPIVDLVEHRGRVHLLETFTEPWTPQTGRVLRLRREGSSEEVVGGLNFPIGLAEWRGDLYVSVNSYFQLGASGTGQIVKIERGGHR
jgi:hypothetical protein